MNSLLQFDFDIDKTNNIIRVRRDFAADRNLVWEAWTNPELLDQWWAPKPYRTVTKSMDMRTGGTWIYAMISPEDIAHWCRADYHFVEPGISFEGLDAFCDEHGNINMEFPRTVWRCKFEGENEKTTVRIELNYESLSDLEKIIEMGFREGFSAALTNLDQYIEARHRLRNSMKADNKSRVTTYLNFPGNTEEAFLFYKKVFRSEFNAGGIQRFGSLPADPSQPPMHESVKNMVLHVELPILSAHLLMGTDAPKEMGFNIVHGNNMHLSLEPETKEEATRIFDELSDGGKISMPLQDMFWGAYFGSFTDRFGINWMVNYRY